ncbi:hypothetical protein NKH48_03310 [Mesorhizobium sp. M1233]|uniref:hypothetical protein n=1 Tax=Mesorhizobium sp. M1233 TaxID=2957072 RepID=UPI00333DFEB0
MGNSTAKKNSGYDPSLDDRARRICLLTNATDEILAELLGFSVWTLQKYKREHPSFANAIARGKIDADMEVAESAHFKATGGMVYETQAIKVRAGKGVEEVKLVEVQKFIPADTQAQRMWLMNRSKYWRPENDQPDAKPSQVVNNNTTINNTTVIVAQVKDDLSEIFGDALPRAATDDTPRVN